METNDAAAMQNRAASEPGSPAPEEVTGMQARLLQGVSRTFALTIPRLPGPLEPVVGNAYLLCRIVDTIEDDPEFSLPDKETFCRDFLALLADDVSAVEPFAAQLGGRLSAATTEAEQELIRVAPQVVGYTRRLDAEQRAAVYDCVREMALGMLEMQQRSRPDGLRDRDELDRYCYYVAGVVGVMLTRLFCHYSPATDTRRDALMRLAPSFGQGLQMTNILKDLWEDRARGVCWLPRSVFADYGFDLGELSTAPLPASFHAGMEHLVGVAHAHLGNAFRYVLLIPAEESEIRDFCLQALGMAMLTLRKIHRHPQFRAGHEVKISRRSVHATVAVSRLGASHDWLLKALFGLAAAGLPREPELEIREP